LEHRRGRSHRRCDRRSEEYVISAIASPAHHPLLTVPLGRRMPVVVGCGAGLAVFLSAFEFTGGRLDGYYNRSEEDSFERRERMLKTRRRPLEETIADVGEGRGKWSALVPSLECLLIPYLGIRPPGYEERRRERIKEKYGFEINPVKATVD
jgi:hypothetical protein